METERSRRPCRTDGAVFVRVSDLKGDGIPDMIVAGQCAYDCTHEIGLLVVLLGSGSGIFQ